jgi:hypothetical protein
MLAAGASIEQQESAVQCFLAQDAASLLNFPALDAGSRAVNQSEMLILPSLEVCSF